MTTRGRLLVATPVLGDPNFERTVVLMLEHNDEGAVGVVLNRPTEATLDEVVPEWAARASRPATIFYGGPVAPEAAICMARLAPGAEPDEGEFTPVLGNVGVLDLSEGPDRFEGVIDQVRIFSGYAGWGADQLAGEIEEGAWFITDADPEDALSAAPEELWRFVLRRSGGRLALFANYPPSPLVN